MEDSVVESTEEITPPRSTRPRRTAEPSETLVPPYPARIVIKTPSPSSQKNVDRSVSLLSFSPRPASRTDQTGHLLPTTSGIFDYESSRIPVIQPMKRMASPTLPDGTERNVSDQKRFRGAGLRDDWRSSQSLTSSARTSIVHPQIGNILMRKELPGLFGVGNTTPVGNLNRKLYSCITPDFTILDIHHPPLYMRKFSPDGRHFAAFGTELQIVVVFRYMGAGAIGRFFPDPDEADETDEVWMESVQKDVFQTLFQEKFKLRVVPEVIGSPHTLCRDFSLYTTDSKYLIVGTVGAAEIENEDSPETRSTNEALPSYHRFPLENYRFLTIDLSTGQIKDHMEFRVDKIQIAHNAGVYLLDDTLTILSLQHQMIHLYTIKDGKFIPKRVLGQYCFDELAPGQTQWTTLYPLVAPSEEEFISTLKQKLYLEFFRQAKDEAKQLKSYGPIMDFHRQHLFFKRLKMWKFQMLDQNRLLIKWVPEDVVLGRSSDPSNYPQFFAFFDMEKCRFTGVWDHRNEKMLEMFEKFPEEFRNTEAQHPEMVVDSWHPRVAYERIKRLTINAKNSGGTREACSRLLSQLPIPSQCFTPSPYVDMSLYQYDTALISNAERIKTKADEPVRFYSRESGALKFTLQVSRVPGGRRSKRFVTHIFHPTDPLIITCEKPGIQINDTDIHIHIRRPV